MTNFSEASVRIRLSKELDLQFEGRRRQLDVWGRPDGYSVIDGVLIFLEVENKQKHPDTNVLKYWPFLEPRVADSIVLIHAFSVESPGSSGSRSRLAKWVAEKMEKQFDDRFKYYRIVFHEPEGRIDGMKELKRYIANIQKRR